MPFSSGIIVPDVLAQGQLSNSNATLYTAPVVPNAVGNMAIIKEIWLANCDSVDHTYTLYRVEAGGTAADNRALYKTITILASSTERIGLSFPLKARDVAGTLTGDTLQGFADVANKVTYTITGATVT